LTKFNVETKKIDKYHIIINDTCKKLVEFVEESHDFPVEIAKFFEMTSKYTKNYLTNANFINISKDSDLSHSVKDFLNKHKLQSLLPFFDLLSNRLTGVSSEQVPFGVFLKVFPPKTLHSLIEYNIPLLGHEISTPPAHFAPGGYNTLMKKWESISSAKVSIFDTMKRFKQ